MVVEASNFQDLLLFAIENHYSKTPDEQHYMMQSKKCCSRGDVARQGIFDRGLYFCMFVRRLEGIFLSPDWFNISDHIG